MRKSYSQFTAEDIKNLGLSIKIGELFTQSLLCEPSAWLLQTLSYNSALPVSTEKARSELLITPVLVELSHQNPEKITVFSGYPFDIDKSKGLKGFCDYLISKKPHAAFVESPVIAIVEVKKDYDLIDAAPQCIAEMVAAQLYNEKHQENIRYIYGAVTTGYEWMFLKLENKEVVLDSNRFMIKNLPELLGVWQVVIDSFN